MTIEVQETKTAESEYISYADLVIVTFKIVLRRKQASLLTVPSVLMIYWRKEV